MDSGLAIALVVVLVVGWFWWTRSRSADDPEAQLRRICSGDQAQVDRLIEGEMGRAPGKISRAEAARRAVDRYRRDNH